MITEIALTKLPVGECIRFSDTSDMDGISRKAVVWSWIDEHHIYRTSYFCVQSGEYLGDTI